MKSIILNWIDLTHYYILFSLIGIKYANYMGTTQMDQLKKYCYDRWKVSIVLIEAETQGIKVSVANKRRMPYNVIQSQLTYIREFIIYIYIYYICILYLYYSIFIYILLGIYARP